MARRRPIDVRELSDRSVSKPRKFRERHKEFLAVEKQPESIAGDVRHLSLRSVFSKRCGVHRCGLRSGIWLDGAAVPSGGNSGLAKAPAQASISLPHQRVARGRASSPPPARRSKCENRRPGRSLDSSRECSRAADRGHLTSALSDPRQRGCGSKLIDPEHRNPCCLTEAIGRELAPTRC